MGDRPHNLPAQPTPLIGRQQEVASARQQLLRADVRLLTLTGPPGVGKTRLALEVAADLLDEFEHGVFFVDLAPIRDPGLVAYTIAQTLGVREVRDQSLFERLNRYLHDKQVLLVLDNFEQVVAAAPQVAELLASCPRLKILVTSREALHLTWEYEFPVPPLGLPDLEPLPALEALGAYPAVALFVERARADTPNFVLSSHNARAVAEFCIRLDGLPLAIELAAARSKMLPPQAMLERLQPRLDLLTGGARDLPVRHQTLRAALRWSCDLLKADEQVLFRRLSVFVGGCTLEAAEAVCDGAVDHALDVPEALFSLVNKSLLQQETQPHGEPRFPMLETIREYGLEQLATSGDLQRIQRRHAAYFLTLAEKAEVELRGPKQAAWLDRLEREHDNLRAALRWSAEHGDAETRLRLSGALWRFWEAHGHLSEGQRWLEEALSESALTPAPSRAKALTGAGALARDRGDYERAAVFLQESLALWRELGDKRGIAASLNILGNVAADHGDYAVARAFHEESLSLFRELGDRAGTAYLLDNLGGDIQYQGDHGEARALHEESLALHRELGNKHGMASALINLGVAAQHLGDYERAKTLHEESLALRRELKDKGGVALVLIHLGFVARYQGDHTRATKLCKESLALLCEVGDRRRIAKCLEALAEAAAAQGQTAQAARIFGVAEALREAIGAPLPPDARPDYDRCVSFVRARLGKRAFAVAWAAGREMPLDQAIEYALHTGEPSATAATGQEVPLGRPRGPLTRREQEVAVLIARGLTNQEIATALAITKGTAANHVQHILNKLGFYTRAQIAAWTVEHGLHTLSLDRR